MITLGVLKVLKMFYIISIMAYSRSGYNWRNEVIEEEKIVKDVNEVKQRENGAGCGTAIASLISGAVVTVIICIIALMIGAELFIELPAAACIGFMIAGITRAALNNVIGVLLSITSFFIGTMSYWYLLNYINNKHYSSAFLAEHDMMIWGLLITIPIWLVASFSLYVTACEKVGEDDSN